MSKIKINVYIAVIAAAGWSALAESVWHWHTDNWIGFLIYLFVSVFVSGFKLRLPGITGTLSAAFFPVLIGIVCLSLPEALVAACGAVLIQCIWHSKKRQLVKVIFNVASVAIAVGSSAALFHSQWLRKLDFEFAVRLAILGITYFVANTLPIAGIIAFTEGKPVWKVWRGSCFWSFPHYLVGAAAAGLFQLTRDYLGWQTALLFIPVICLLYRVCALHIGRIDDARVHAEETAELYLRTMTSLALAIEAKDQDTHDHLQRVQVYAMEVGKELRLSPSDLEALRAAALLHDIGKIAVPDHILGKPGKLTPEEFQKMKVHPVVGAEILERVRFPFPVASIVRCHHEKWDGSGYPAGLKGEEIPIGARILTAVDFLDALSSDRHYRRALPLDEAMAALERESGKGFDPRVVEVLKRRYIQLEQMARSSPMEPWRLSTDIHIEKGAAPGAGFADIGARPDTPREATPASEVSDLMRLRQLLDAVNSGERFLSFGETISLLATRLGKVVPYDSLAVYVPRGGALLPVYTAGTHRELLASLVIPVGQGVSGWAAEANRPIVNGNPAMELRGSAASCISGAPGSALALPLPGTLGPVGVLTLYGSGPNAFHSEDLKVLASFAAQLASYLEKNSSEMRASGASEALTECLSFGQAAARLSGTPVLIH